MNKGIIKISETIVRDAKLIALLFEKVKPLRLEQEIYSPSYILLCESDEFDETKEGDAYGWYDVTVCYDIYNNPFIKEIIRYK